MRRDIVHPGADELRYEIRSIVAFAQKLENVGVPITWENIGDPIAKGEAVPAWVRSIVADEAQQSMSYGYSPTKGLNEAREYLAATRSEETKNNLSPENVMFFNGLGDAISKVYTWLHPSSRVLGPSPAYPTHSSIEGAHGRSEHLTYLLDPKKAWMPDMEDVRNKVRYNPNIAALLIINPDNPTGAVYPKEILEQFVAIAEEFDLFLIADEIYANLTFDGDFTSLASVSRDIPTIIMRGLSKEVPWPGSRCGWLEFYNTDKDWQFERYAQSIENAKMNEVCSTTLPQAALPKILADARYRPHLQARREKYAARATSLAEALADSSQFDFVKPKGAFYASVTFSDAFDLNKCGLQPANEKAAALLADEIANDATMPIDKRFCLELLASTGVCTVPLSSGFNSHIQGFRMTLLEENTGIFLESINLLALK